MRKEWKYKDPERWVKRFAWFPIWFTDAETKNTVFIWLESYWKQEVAMPYDITTYRTIHNPKFYEH